MLEQGRPGRLLGPVGLQQRGRVDPQVAGVGAQEALGVDAPAELAELLLLERLQVAGPDPGRHSGVVERLALRFAGRAQRFADGAQRGHPFIRTYRGNSENRFLRSADSAPWGGLRNLLADDLAVAVLAAAEL